MTDVTTKGVIEGVWKRLDPRRDERDEGRGIGQQDRALLG